MEPGNIVEYIDRQKIICAVVLKVKKQRLRLLDQTNREVNLADGRLSHTSKMRLDLSIGRDKLVAALKETVNRRNALTDAIDIKGLWEVLNSEQEWIDLASMTEFCFPDNPTGDHESAVVRAFFKNRVYFKFNHDRFFPNTPDHVEQIMARDREAARKNLIIEEGSAWLKEVLTDNTPSVPDSLSEDVLAFVTILKSLYIFEKESEHYAIGQAMLERAGIDSSEDLFKVLVKLSVFDKNENIDLSRYEISISFPDKVTKQATELASFTQAISAENGRKDLTALNLMTIDGPSTLDYDDALSIEDQGNHYGLGVHIADVGHFIKKGDIIDNEALARGSSIYMPDQKIAMLPEYLAEDVCSLKAGELRPAISIMAKLSRSGKIVDYEVIPSTVRVLHQLTYGNVDMMVDENKDISMLYDIAKRFRQYRLSQGAVQISLPEINIILGENGQISVVRIDRKDPSRMLVEEMMIIANWLMAGFLAKHNTPAIFRSQPGPRDRLYKGTEGTLFQNYMQRKLLNRFILSNNPEHHSGLGLDAYVTATSPIRKYFDLVTQRQIRAVLGLEEPYPPEALDNIIRLLEQPMSRVFSIQQASQRYWLFKYLEKKVGQKKEAIILYKRKHNYQVLIPAYMIECEMPLSGGIELKPQDLVQITLQHVNARKDALSVYMG